MTNSQEETPARKGQWMTVNSSSSSLCQEIIVVYILEMIYLGWKMNFLRVKRYAYQS